MAHNHFDSLLHASGSEDEEFVGKYLSLLHLGSELLAMDRILDSRPEDVSQKQSTSSWKRIFKCKVRWKSNKSKRPDELGSLKKHQ